jgi:very-short-patch-repair endonuclease
MLYAKAIKQALESAGFVVEFEYRFHDTRRFRFDVAIPTARLAVEIEGAVFVRGGHSSGSGITRDCEKYNLATESGWRVLRYPTHTLRDTFGECLDQILRVAKC